MQPVPSGFAQEDSHDGREVEVSDLLRAKSVYRLKEYRERRVDTHDPSECLYSKEGRKEKLLVSDIKYLYPTLIAGIPGKKKRILILRSQNVPESSRDTRSGPWV
jgi:hypothetical protein